MTVEAHAERIPTWVHPAAGAGQWVALAAQCTLSRNLSDFPFPMHCNDDERHAVEARILDAFERTNLFGSGRYHHAADLDTLSWQFLAERRLVSRELLHAPGHRGVYVADTQCFSAMLNGADHLVMRALAPGLSLQDAWRQVSATGDGLSRLLDFSFHDRLGFLTSRLGMVGTGLRASVVLHLPALSLLGGLEEQAGSLRQRGVELHGLAVGDHPLPGGIHPPLAAARGPLETDIEPMSMQCLLTDLEGGVCTSLRQATGDLYLLVNQDTLGISEEDIVFRVSHCAAELAAEEEQARQTLYRRGALELADRVGRALALGRGARLVSFMEALEWLSLLRLGASLGLLGSLTQQPLNELMLAVQAAHLAVIRGAELTQRTLCAERANLLRERLSD